MSGVAAGQGRGCWRRVQGAGQGHRSRVRGGVYFGASALYITGVGDAYFGRAAGVGNLAPGSCAEWVYVSTVCVRACVCAWGGVSAPEPVGCAGWEEEARGAARPFVQPGDLGRDRER